MRAFKQKNCYDAKASDTVSKRSEKAFLKGAGILCACVFAGAAGACKKDDSVKEGKIYDFYGTAEFVLPFESENYTKTGVLNFDTDLTMEQMTEKTKSAGYGAELYDFDGVKRMLITQEQGGCNYYFLIYDKTLPAATGNGSAERFTLCDLSESFRINDKQYVFLFPQQFAEAKNSGLVSGATESKKVYCTFNEFADFYRNTGKDDVTIDSGNRTVTFSCKASVEQNGIDANHSAGEILLSYTEAENGNYVNVSLKS